MKKAAQIFFLILLFIGFNKTILPQTNENVKMSGINAGIIFPVGDWSSDYGIGFNVADLTKWSISEYTRILGRVEITFIGGKKVTKQMYGYSYSYTTNPSAILTAGTGVQLNFTPNSGFYSTLDFPSMNIIISNNSNISVGIGIGLGYNFSLGKAFLGFQLKGVLYNALLTQNGEKSIAAIQFGFETSY